VNDNDVVFDRRAFLGAAGGVTLGAVLLRSTPALGAGPRRIGGPGPVFPPGAAPERATFVDPTATILRPGRVTLEERIFVAPFARLLAGPSAPIVVRKESDVQDRVSIEARAARDDGDTRRVRSLGLADNAGVEVGERVILAHGSTVRGPARVGVGGTSVPANEGLPKTFVSFGAQVDGAILEKNTQVSPLGRVGPGVRLRSGFLVLPGRNVTTQAEADDPARGKVARIEESNVQLAEAVIEVNTGFAREYTRLYQEDPTNVLGINFDPGNLAFNPTRELPTLAGHRTREPSFRNRIVGDVRLADDRSALEGRMGNRISLRADEGEPFSVGHIDAMGDEVVFHALEEAQLVVGDRVVYGRGAIVHGGGRPGTGEEPAPTTVEDGVLIGPGAVVFQSLIGAGSILGSRSVILGTELPPGTIVPPDTVYLEGQVFGRVEW